jgi:Domain of unknown function (DUF4160)
MSAMPTISAFYGITIRMYWSEHGPPHFHAIHAGNAAVFAIEDLHIVHGDLPRRAVTLILEWARLHQDELRRNWQLCAAKQTPIRIPPLE